jgi:hypothetical protein
MIADPVAPTGRFRTAIPGAGRAFQVQGPQTSSRAGSASANVQSQGIHLAIVVAALASFALATKKKNQRTRAVQFFDFVFRNTPTTEATCNPGY